ncbi:hypothetical protein [Erythrobacter sp.]|uniref:hypothetical protein n=1 Tax=Erythrobacter sp. TaxID=1042 RepID=UPI002EA8AC18|nr:hypothetical protein [Erythrobacter sp.]
MLAQIAVFLALLAVGLSFLLMRVKSIPALWRWSVWGLAAIIAPITAVALYEGIVRDVATKRLDPEAVFARPLLHSIRHTQFNVGTLYVHGAALKDCRAYLWSYRRMDYVEISPGRTGNLLPREWKERCPNLYPAFMRERD